MRIRYPMIIDSAYNNLGADWTKMGDSLWGMYVKATEGQFTRDPQFPASWAQLRNMGKPRAAYHFYRESWYGMPRDPIAQANFFYNRVKEFGIIPGDRFVLDAEDNSMTIQKILACAREIRRLSGYWPILYSGFYYLKDNTKGYELLTDAEIDDLKKLPIIISAYLTDGDNYEFLPGTLVPDQRYFGSVVGWQYAGDVKPEVHKLPGLNPYYNNDLDFNVFLPEFLEDWKTGYYMPEPEPEPLPEPPVPDTGTSFTLRHFDVVNYYGNSTRVHVASFNLAEFDVILDNRLNFMTTDRWAEQMNVDYAVNGLAGWYPGPKKRGIVQTILDGMAFFHGTGVMGTGYQNLYIDQNNRFSVFRPVHIWNAHGFPNVLLRDFVVQTFKKTLDDLRARTAVGVTEDQTRLYVVTVDGKDYAMKEGLNFPQTAEIMKSLGCKDAWMADGGGSTTAILKTADGKYEVVGTPWGEETCIVNGSVYKMRPVAVHFGLRRKS
jgi:GH25 family lysozyme M1 (1,4-beta-N-acetylmuramidase)